MFTSLFNRKKTNLHVSKCIKINLSIFSIKWTEMQSIPKYKDFPRTFTCEIYFRFVLTLRWIIHYNENRLSSKMDNTL